MFVIDATDDAVDTDHSHNCASPGLLCRARPGDCASPGQAALAFWLLHSRLMAGR